LTHYYLCGTYLSVQVGFFATVFARLYFRIAVFGDVLSLLPVVEVLYISEAGLKLSSVEGIALRFFETGGRTP
jgi:hypothetical protein